MCCLKLESDRFMIAADLLLSKFRSETENLENLTGLANTDHLLIRHFKDVSSFWLADTLGRLFGSTVRHLVLANFDFDLVQLLSHFKVLKTLVLLRLPACDRRQKALFRFLGSSQMAPQSFENFYVFEKEYLARLEVENMKPLLGRLKNLSLAGYDDCFDNLPELLVSMNPVHVEKININID